MKGSYTKARGVALLVAAVGGLGPVDAGAVCQIRSATAPNFGVYTPTATLPRDATGAIVYRCDGQPQFQPVTIDLSTGSGSDFLNRRLQGPSGNRLNYNLYLDATRLLVWGNGTLGTSRYGPVFPVNAVEVTLTLYGRIPAGQAAVAGAYSDTVVMTLTY
ncbi:MULTISPECIES: spore coat U domain-containing protein [unclassified Myxococcus]|jgi:spore coat protein U-like protein|uniref:Csu type fimbrial protein n=1 Tax=unclassified Myxococcus TaxID=2648731 RepID=UPI001CC1564A|nr:MULTISPECIES: spore coat U domain-containing protein [unclassified Myxococcus]MBZ4399850.1 spore coat U domain-containing protein [Myxococcus sp. AS-1-15]MBZ4409914.1 spore coat U domain-containing protein [Myxococcus sp. XM-1-1-1]